MCVSVVSCRAVCCMLCEHQIMPAIKLFTIRRTNATTPSPSTTISSHFTDLLVARIELLAHRTPFERTTDFPSPYTDLMHHRPSTNALPSSSSANCYFWVELIQAFTLWTLLCDRVSRLFRWHRHNFFVLRSNPTVQCTSVHQTMKWNQFWSCSSTTTLVYEMLLLSMMILWFFFS